ncbi:MAG: N-acetylmuramoyl-L-alanine amidase [Candidatus Viridilinea halotolerans]|uniref:N-acetylmuramoyl-L-alanine amidase n=1 Tax=Candidatus Viridilinea halotolerans TaxID=2491704 RepID=A0A426TW64_9CHLR|nr:MAG: N-acetylmuramoyl-L-alanine amidase [Candidatus Viridilinea halotolerans]
MTPLACAIRDIRAHIPRAAWSIGSRAGAPRYLTLHYNGPVVRQRTPAGEVAQLVANARHHMRPGALGATSGGDGLQYHLAVLSDGDVVQCRDLGDMLWHCGHRVGNPWSLSIHLPLGGQQDATAAQWAQTTQLFDALRTAFAIPKERILGHQEWGRSACPGPLLMTRLVRWRNAAPATPLTQTLTTRTATAIHEGPSSRFPVALTGTAHLAADMPIPVNAILTGTLCDGDIRWLHLRSGLGFVPLSATYGLAEG